MPHHSQGLVKAGKTDGCNSMSVRKIMVDAHGRPLDGSELMTATKEAVESGYMVNVPVVFCYPDGRRVRGHDAEITQKGLAVAAQEIGRNEPRH